MAPQVASGWGLGARGTNSVMSEFSLNPPTSTSCWEGRSGSLGSLTRGGATSQPGLHDKPPRNPGLQDSEPPAGGWRAQHGAGALSTDLGSTQKLCAAPAQHLALCTCPIHLFLSCILYNNTGIASTARHCAMVSWAMAGHVHESAFHRVQRSRKVPAAWRPTASERCSRVCGGACVHKPAVSPGPRECGMGQCVRHAILDNDDEGATSLVYVFTTLYSYHCFRVYSF